MNNIALSNFESCRLDKVQTCEVFCVDEDSILIYGEGKVIKFSNKSSLNVFTVTDNLYPTSDENPKALELSQSFDKSSLFLFFYNGDIVVIEVKSEHTWSADVVGSVEGGLKAAKWSPDNELVALVSGNDSVIVMTNSFEPLSEVDLHGNGFGVKQFKTVGWGRKETQFRGSEGKYKSTENNQISDIKILVSSDDRVRISWRGDGELFAVSSINPETAGRYLRIFDKLGTLQYTSEYVMGLEHCLHWRPAGNLITSTVRLQNKHNVCFFEKNGLKHGEFTLPYKQNEVVVKELMWNEDSRLLALLLEKIVNKSDVNDLSDRCEEKFILIYCSNNYHWYCKYKIPLNGTYGKNEVLMKWDQLSSNMLHVILKKGDSIHHMRYTWIWTIHKSRGRSSNDGTFVAVIDGSKLLLTSFKSGILPPPLCTYSLEMSSQINAISFAPLHETEDTSSNDFLVQLSNGFLCFYKYEGSHEKQDHMSHKLIGQMDSSKKFIFNIHWVSPKTFVCCEATLDSVKANYSLNVMDFNDYNMQMSFSDEVFPIESSVALLTSYSESYILFHDNAGHTFVFDRYNKEFTCMYSHEKRNLIELDVTQKKDGSFIIFGRDKSNKFFINDESAANNVTSFHIHDNFLLLTTLKNTLICVPIEEGTEKTLKLEPNEISSRKIEPGSRLITSVLNGAKVVMQLPRGNLECVQPRALSLFVTRALLDELHYSEAFKIMRQQRINLNLLHDHNPQLFRENVERFINEIKDPDWISLFLSSLIDEDVTKTMYSTIYKNNNGDHTDKSKIQVVCEILEKTLRTVKESERYVLPLLATFIRRGETQHIESALSIIKKLKEAESKGEKLPVTFGEAFRYILYFIDEEDLYKVALGMYDFDLVLMVATESQKNPKEYLPFLNEWRKLEANYQKYTIDKYLKRYEKALKHLLHCGGDDYFSECLCFIKSQKLYKVALKLVPHTTDRYKQICACYADELLASHFYEEAGTMFYNSGSYSNAMAAFKKSGNWQEVISCSMKLKLTNQELNEVFLNLAGELIEGKRFKEASTVYLDYLKNPELALVSLCLGKMFAEAFRIAELYGRDDIVQVHIKPGILECYRATKMQLLSYGEVFAAQKKRLKFVREKKALQAEARALDPDSEQDAFSDVSSVTTQSYAGSRATNRTFRSAKNKRKQERKLLSLKEGSQYEDLALIASLHNIATNCYEMKTEVRELNKALVKIDEDSLAEEVQNLLEKLLKEIEDSTEQIWTPELRVPTRQSFGPGATSNSIAASFSEAENLPLTNLINPQLLIPPRQTNVRWHLEFLKS